MDLPVGCVERCPGCEHRALSGEESARCKEEWLSRRLEGFPVEPVRAVPLQGQWNYREKTTLAARWSDGGWNFGMILSGRGSREDELVAIPDCPVHSERVREVFKAFAVGLPAPERFPLVFVSIAGALATLVLKSADVPDLSFLDRFDFKRLGLSGVFLNLNPSAGRRVFASRGWKHVWGMEKGIVLGAGLVHGPGSFQQLVPSLYENALDEARSFLDPRPGDSVLDLYSGIGASTRLWKAADARFVGVELCGESVDCARENVGGEILRGRVSERIPQLKSWVAGGSGRLLAFMNPPRTGLEFEVADWLAREAGAERLAYLSCSAGTLTRDLGVFTSAGYAVRRVIPFDFFPRTKHVETLVLLGVA